MNKTTDTVTMKKIDYTAINEYGISSLTLMENAATAVYKCIKENYKNAKQICIFCGPGNNGGDGITVSRLLMNDGYKVRCFLVGNRKKMTDDAKTMEKKLSQTGGKLEDFILNDDVTKFINQSDLIIDAIFGVGLQREIGGDFLAAINAINSSNKSVIACDIPSGIDGNNGKVLGVAVKADYTITFSLSKYGLEKGDGKEYSGKVIIADIGIPDEIIDKFCK